MSKFMTSSSEEWNVPSETGVSGSPCLVAGSVAAPGTVGGLGCQSTGLAPSLRTALHRTPSTQTTTTATVRHHSPLVSLGVMKSQPKIQKY